MLLTCAELPCEFALASVAVPGADAVTLFDADSVREPDRRVMT
jgi:hypothetical protein